MKLPKIEELANEDIMNNTVERLSKAIEENYHPYFITSAAEMVIGKIISIGLDRREEVLNKAIDFREYKKFVSPNLADISGDLDCLRLIYSQLTKERKIQYPILMEDLKRLIWSEE